MQEQLFHLTVTYNRPKKRKKREKKNDKLNLQLFNISQNGFAGTFMMLPWRI